MVRRTEFLALIAPAGRPAAASGSSGNATEAVTESADDREFRAEVVAARADCADYAGEISEHPEADARVDFAAGKRGRVAFLNQNRALCPQMPESFTTRACPSGKHKMWRLKAMESKPPCLENIGATYMMRYNLELVRLCSSRPCAETRTQALSGNANGTRRRP